MGEPKEGQMTIGELARRTGMTVRNIRAHQTRGLLPPPDVHGRTGYYDEEHVARISLILELQAEGLNLAAVRHVLESADGSPQLVEFARSLRLPFEDEAPEIIEADELATSWGADAVNPRLLGRAEKLGILRQLPDGRIEVISPRLQKVGAALLQLGVKPDAVLDTADELHRRAEGMAVAFIDLFVKQVWDPFQDAGRPEEDWPKVRDALERMRPLASDALLAMFQLVMAEKVERASEETLRAAASAAAGRRSGTASGRSRR